LSKFDKRNWMDSEEGISYIADVLDEAKHFLSLKKKT